MIRRTGYALGLLFVLACALALMVTRIKGCATGAPASSTSVRNDRIQWYLHRASPLRSSTQTTFVTFSTLGPIPRRDQLIAALEKPESFAAAHMLLLNGPTPTTQPGTFDANSAHRDMALRLKAEDRIALQDRPDGSCVAVIDGLHVILRPAEKRGAYFGQGRVDHTVYAATAEVDPSQQRAIRDQWRRRPPP